MADSNQAPAGEGSKKVQNLLKMGFIVLNLSVTGGGLYLAYKGTIGWEAPVYSDQEARERLQAEQAELEKLPLIFTLESFKANLSDTPVRAVEIELSVEMMNRLGYEELVDGDNQAKIRDEILRIIQGKSYDDIATVQGKLFLKDQFAEALNKVLQRGIVKDVFFSQFKIE